jgi:hypothetical protein
LSTGIAWTQPEAQPLTSGKIPGELLFFEQPLYRLAILDDLNGPPAIDMLDGNASRPGRIFSVHGSFFDLRASASRKARAAASQAVLEGPFANSTISAALSDIPCFLAKTAVS